MVVDNDQLIREFMHDILSREGHQVVTVVDGLSALDVLKNYVPDIMFVDLVMPNIDGKRLLKIIGQDERFQDAFLVVISSLLVDEDIDLAVLGAHAFIPKGPFNEMTRAVHSVLDRKDLKSTVSLSQEAFESVRRYPRQFEAELLSAKKHFEIILERMSEGIIEITSEGRIVYANPACISLINVPEERLLGSHFIELFAENDRPAQ